MKPKKRTQQTMELIKYMNKYLKNNNITSEDDVTFHVFTNALISAGVYFGYIRRSDYLEIV